MGTGVNYSSGAKITSRPMRSKYQLGLKVAEHKRKEEPWMDALLLFTFRGNSKSLTNPVNHNKSVSIATRTRLQHVDIATFIFALCYYRLVSKN